MPIAFINALDDPRLSAYRHLKQTNATRWSQTFIAEGEKLARRLLASDFPVLSVLVDAPHQALFAPLVPAEVPLYVVPEQLVEALVGYNFHRGVLACGSRKPQLSLEQMVLPAERPLTLVVCAEVQDPENLGAIARIGCSFGIDGLILGPGCCQPFSRRVLRVSMGAVWRLALFESSDLLGDLACLCNHDVELVATVLDAEAQSLSSARRARRTALVFGNEGHGLPAAVAQCCQRCITIPMQPSSDSLNVAVTAGIVLHHFCRA